MTTTESTRPSRVDRRLILVAVIAPLVLTLAGVALQMAWLPELPASVATHWGIDGADGFGPAWSSPVLLAVVGISLAGGLGSLLVFAARRTPATFERTGLMTSGQKIVALASLFSTTLIAVGTTGVLALQRGIADRSDAPPATPVLLVAVGSALVLSGAAWFFLPRVSRLDPEIVSTPALPLGVGERAAWVGTAQFATPLLIVIGASGALAAGAIAYAVAVAGVWPVAILGVAVVLLMISATSWRVRIDQSGLDARGVLGWPRVTVPLADVASAGTIDVTPLGEFGGYGLRVNARATGVITRSGEALDVRRRDGRSAVVTVDDAATAAALLQALIAR
ncbi:DUF1648 domain-containing protein [soil metagenome]